MSDEDVQSIHFCLFQKDIVDDRLLYCLHIAIFYLVNIICYDLLVVEARVERIGLKLRVDLSQYLRQRFHRNLKDILIINHIEELEIPLVVIFLSRQ